MTIRAITWFLLCLLVPQARGQAVWPTPDWARASPSDVAMDESRLQAARDYALTGKGSGYITRHGKLVLSWGDPARRYDLKSTTKSIGVTALGLAIGDGKLQLTDPVVQHHPRFAVPPDSNSETGWIEKITIHHLATQTAGFEKPGGYTRLVYEPGTRWLYSDGGPNWLAECVTLAYGRDVDELMFERVFTPLGIDRQDLVWRRNAYRDARIDGVMRREFGSGISANVDAMARIGYLYLHGGQWNGKQILPRRFVEMASRPIDAVVGLQEMDAKNHGNASDHYGLLWWNNADGTLSEVPRDAFWSWGLYDSLIIVIPSLDLVVARAGESWPRTSDEHYDVLRPFLVPIVASIKQPVESGEAAESSNCQPTPAKAAAKAGDQDAPYPPSTVIRGIHWADASTIVRQAKGSDNWPITWGDDDRLYTAYGDGRGFEPFTSQKLSLGLAAIEGSADDFQAANLRAPTAEFTGDGAAGPKASGMLMVHGTLYMWARNTENAQLAWSANRGQTWTWADWKFTSSFGAPTFLNFAANYSGARDQYVYVYSLDGNSAYQRTDGMVLARVPDDQIPRRQAYQFFAGLDDDGQPLWTSDIARRSHVFSNPGRCYRSSVSYIAPLKRYLWCQTGAGQDTRFAGGLAIYDAPEPWGPWTTVFHTDQWDVGPGESSCIPTKWVSADGQTIHLVFSGDDCFSVRRGALILALP